MADIPANRFMVEFSHSDGTKIDIHKNVNLCMIDPHTIYLIGLGQLEHLFCDMNMSLTIIIK